MCEETILFTCLFDPEVRIPDSGVTATVSRRKEQRAIGGTAGRKRRRLIEERACDEKTVDSKVKYLNYKEPQDQAPEPEPELVVPEAVLHSSSDNDFQVHTHVAADRMPD